MVDDTQQQHMISAQYPDWAREDHTGGWNPSRALLKSLRDYQQRKNKGWILASKVAVLRHRFWSIVTGADIPLNCRIAGGLQIPHPNGVVIHPDATIGPNCLIFQQVTIGANGDGVPSLGGHVDVGAGAKIIGPVQIGDHAVIGANAVVVEDVPEHATVAGVPAKRIDRTKPR